MKSQTDKIHFYLKFFFWCNIVVLTTVFLLLLQIKGPDFGKDMQSNIIFERYAIIFTLIAIPGALKLYSVLINKKKDMSPDQSAKRYVNLYMLRAGMLDAAVIVNLIGFYMNEAVNFVYLTIIALFAVCFSFPNKIVPAEEVADIENDVESENEEEL